MDKPTVLSAKALYQDCDLDQFEFKTTAELEPLDQPLGQGRALEAIEFGIDIDQQGFNLFVVGDPGIGKQQLVRQVLSRRAQPADDHPDHRHAAATDGGPGARGQETGVDLDPAGGERSVGRCA